MFPLKQKFKDKGPLCQLSAKWLNCVQNMLDGLEVVAFPSTGDADSAAARITSPNRDGTGWKIEIPVPDGAALDDTTGATKGMVKQITDDTTTPPTSSYDWVRATA